MPERGLDNGQVEEARSLASEVLEEEARGYEARLHSRLDRFLFAEGRQADLFAGAEAQAKVEVTLRQEGERAQKEARLARTLGGAFAGGVDGVTVAVVSRKGRAKEVTFQGARRAAQFAVAVERAGLAWRLKRPVVEKVEAAREARLWYEAQYARRYEGDQRRYLVRRGLPTQFVRSLGESAEASLRPLLAATRAAQLRAAQRRRHEVDARVARVEGYLSKGETLSKVLAGIGVRPGTLDVPEFRLMTRKAALQLAGAVDPKVASAPELTDFSQTLSTEDDRPLVKALVVVSSPADALAHYQLRGGLHGTDYLVLGSAPVWPRLAAAADGGREDLEESAEVAPSEGLGTGQGGLRFWVGASEKARSIERVLLTERWRNWEGGENAPKLVLAVGPERRAEGKRIVEKLLPILMEVVEESPQHSQTWWQELQKREQDFVRRYGPARAVRFGL